VPILEYHIAACVQNAPIIVGSLERSFSKPEEHFWCVIYIRTRRQSKYIEERTVSDSSSDQQVMLTDMGSSFRHLSQKQNIFPAWNFTWLNSK